MLQQSKCSHSPLRSALYRFVAMIFGGVLLGATSVAQAQQTPANPARITQAVDNTALTPLKGNVHPLARPQYDRGPVNPSLSADRMQLVLKRSSSQEIGLRQFLGSLQDPNSPQYRKWLTPEQFGAQYGVSDADIQTVSAWLAWQGFQVNQVNKARTIIEFSGTVGQLQSAFHTQIHSFNVNGEQHIANISDPQIPAALSPVVAGLSSMNNFFPKPPHTQPQSARYDKASRKFEPDLTLGSASAGYDLFVGPGDAATIYDAPNTFNANFTGGTSYTGANVAIGVIGHSDIDLTAVANYRSLFGLPAAAPTVVLDGNDPGPVSGWDTEALLDLEASGGLAPGASQIFYLADDTAFDPFYFLAINRALDDNAVSIVSMSVQTCELYLGTSANQLIYSLWEQAAAQGISAVVSSSDSGSAGCDDFDSQQQAQLGLQVNGLSSTPFNISVGGTDYDVLATDFTKYASTTNRSDYGSALGYIPELPWNDSTATNGALTANTPLTESGGTNIVAGSGGISGCVAPDYDSDGNFIDCGAAYASGSLTGWAKPSWQTGGKLKIPADGVRDLPDVSLLAGDGLYGATWLICTDDVDSNAHVHNCADEDGFFYFEGVGGTSASAPAFAGILALVSQSQGGVRLGQANYVLYNLANQASLYASVFHDVTEGNNSVYCVAGSLDCGSNLFETGYDAGTEYDLASGLGSVDVSQLIKNWGKATFSSSTTGFTINGGTAPVSITHGQTVTLNANVTGAGGTPTGDVAIVGNANQEANTSNSNWIGSYTLTGGTTGPQSFSNLPGGTYTVSANYGGDISFAQSQSSPAIQVTVAKENSILNLAAQTYTGNVTPAATYPYGTFITVDATPVGQSQINSQSPAYATGSVTFSDTAGLPSAVSGRVPINSFGYAELPVYYWPPASHSVSASYAGDNSFNSSSAAAIPFTITKATTSSYVTVTPTSLSSGTFTVNIVIAPTPTSGATAPSGMVNITIDGDPYSATLQASQNPSTGASIAIATLTVNSNILNSGANAITSTYGGDANYLGSSNSATVTFTGLLTPTVSPSFPSYTISAEDPFTATVTVSGPSGSPVPTGSVVLSGGLYTSAATPLSNGVATITVPAGTWGEGTINLLFAYTPDAASAAVYNPVQVGSGQLTIVAPSGTFTLTGTAVSINSPGGSGTSQVAVTPTGGFSGTVNLTCSLSTSPSGASSAYAPTCSLSAASVTLSGTAASTVTATFATTAPTSGSLVSPQTNRGRDPWYAAAGGAALAGILFLGVPGRRKSWKAMLGLLLCIVAMAGAGCGGGGGGSSNNNPGTAGTTPGVYTFIVAGSNGPTSALLKASTTITLTVQ